MAVPVPGKGSLLVAAPPLEDPNFDRTVVLVLEHGDEGTVGLVLNRPSDTPVAEALPGWERLVADPAVVFVGGPVGETAAIAVGTAIEPANASGWQPVVGALGTVDLRRQPEDVAGDIGSVRLFAGYAGWGPGQLEAELRAGAWLVVTAEPGDAVDPDVDDLWRRVLRRQGGAIAWLANAPADPTVN